MSKTAEQVVAEALVGTILTGSRVLSPEQREDVVAITVTALREAGMLRDALDADTVDDRTEWEYGYTSKCGKTATTSRENAERHARFIREEIELGRSSGDLRYHGKVIRRKASKAGEWEEIPNE